MPARILVIAAQPPLQEQLGNMLRRDGYEIVLGRHGRRGPAPAGAARSTRPDRRRRRPARQDGLEVVGRIREAELDQHAHAGHPARRQQRRRRQGRGAARRRRRLPCHADPSTGAVGARSRPAGTLRAHARACRAAREADLWPRASPSTAPRAAWARTTLAINTAIALHRELKRSVALVDANLQFGDHRVFLDLGPNCARSSTSSPPAASTRHAAPA